VPVVTRTASASVKVPSALTTIWSPRISIFGSDADATKGRA